MEALLKLNDCSVLSEELSVQAGITLQFLISGSGLIPSGLHFAPLSLRPVRVLLSSFSVAENKSILVGFSFRLSSAHVGYPLARDLLLRAGSGHIDQSEDFIAMMYE